MPFGGLQVSAIEAREGQGRRLAMNPREHRIDRRSIDAEAMLGGEGGVGVAHGLAQADQGAHRIQQQALRGRQGRGHPLGPGHSLGPGHPLGQGHSLSRGHPLGRGHRPGSRVPCQGGGTHRQSASQPAATRSWWDSPGMRAR